MSAAIRLIFSSAARDDLLRLREFIRTHRPESAAKAAERIMHIAAQLLEFPHMGSLVRADKDYRDIIFTFGQRGYVLRYLPIGDCIHILRIWHVRETRS